MENGFVFARTTVDADLCDASADVGFGFRVEQPGVARRGQRDERGAGAVGQEGQ